MSKKQTLTYESALQELQTLLQQVETGRTDLNDLPKVLERARELIHFCKSALRATDAAVEQLLKEDGES